MSQLIMPRQGEIKEIFLQTKNEIKQPQKGLPFQEESSFKKVLAKVDQGDEQAKTASLSDSAEQKAETPYDEEGQSRGGLVDKEKATEGASNKKREITHSFPAEGRENTPDHEELTIGAVFAAAASMEKAAQVSEKENRVLPGMSHPPAPKGGKGETASSPGNALEKENHAAHGAEKALPIMKGAKGEINLASLAMNKQEKMQPADLHGKGTRAEAAVLAANMKKGEKAGSSPLGESLVKKMSDIQITKISSLDTRNHSQMTDTRPSVTANLPPDPPASQEKTPFTMGANDLQKEGTPGKEEFVAVGKESVSPGSASEARAQQIYAAERIMPRGIVIPMEQIVQETGKLLEKGGKIQIVLHPPSLGQMNMEVVVRNNRVELIIMVGNVDVQQTLQASSDQLRNALQNQGFQFDQMSVLLKKESMDSHSGERPLWQDGQRDGEKREGRQEFAGEILLEPESMRYDETRGLSIFV
ncbi:MAG: flagellar hook-length control protein FliK [Syntrophobacterales bacterium]|nr:flagellar hook-length control protein FliK [Syntrophobacterales bacterium]